MILIRYSFTLEKILIPNISFRKYFFHKGTGQSVWTLEEIPASRSLDDIPASRSLEDIPALRSLEDIPASRSLEDIPASRSLEDIPALRYLEDIPASRSLENIPASRSTTPIQDRLTRSKASSPKKCRSGGSGEKGKAKPGDPANKGIKPSSDSLHKQRRQDKGTETRKNVVVISAQKENNEGIQK